ncbi:MAG: hypothetical protein RLZ98_3338 [Pseudomonadota bacterium]
MRFAKLIGLLALAGGVAFYVLTAPTTLPADVFVPRQANLSNGETMFHAGGCASCHKTEGQKDKTRLGGGHALATPFGTFLVPNISPHPRHGLGSWSELQFANAMLKGVGKDGEHLYPSFPYTSYQRMKLDDVRDLFAYIKTLPQDATPNAPHKLSFPFNVRRGLGLWKLKNLDGKSFEPDPAKSPELNRGAYLVEGPSHCAECHSERDFSGGIDPNRRHAGGPNPSGKGWIPNITPHESGLKSWSAKDIAYLLATGQNPEFDSVGSTMADVVENTAKLSPADRQAMAAYLKSLPPRPSNRPSSGK